MYNFKLIFKMSLDKIFANKLVLEDNPHQTMDIIQYEIFHNNLNIYDVENCYIILGVPNVQCKVYFDDEDFIYAKLGLSETDYIDFNVINYLANHYIILDFSKSVIELKTLYAKILYLYQFSSVYYGSLSSLIPSERMFGMPKDLLIWLDNVVDIIRVVIDNDLFNLEHMANKIQNTVIYNDMLDITIKQILGLSTESTINTISTNKIIDDQYLKELIIGLNLIICHIKMLLNHYKIKCIPIVEMDEKHIKKLFKLINNMCIIIIHLPNMF